MGHTSTLQLSSWAYEKWWSFFEIHYDMVEKRKWECEIDGKYLENLLFNNWSNLNDYLFILI